MEEFLKKINTAKHEIILPLDSQSRIRGSLLQYMRKNPVAETTVSRYSNFKFFGNLFLKPLPAFSAIILLFVILGSGTAFAASGANPGDQLFPLKLAIENARIGLTFNADAKADLQMNLANQRLEETAEVSGKGNLNSNVKDRIESNFQRHANAVAARITKLQEQGNIQDADDLLTKFDQSLEAHQAILARLEVINKENKDNLESVEAKVNLVINNLNKTQTINEDKANNSNEKSATGRINAAKNIINSTGNFIEAKNARGGTATKDKLDRAGQLLQQAQSELKAGQWSQAFISANQAIQSAHQAKDTIQGTVKGDSDSKFPTNYNNNFSPPTGEGINSQINEDNNSHLELGQ